MLTRLAQSGTDAFSIMKLAGHCSVIVSQRYVHPGSRAIGLAMGRMEAFNSKALLEASEGQIRELPATVSATSEATKVDAQAQVI